MNARRITVLVTRGTCLLLLAGCFALPWTRTGNQGGSTPVTLLAKLAAGNIGDLNPDDIQVATDIIRDVAKAPLDEVSDDLAAAVVETIQANGIESIQDLERVARDVEQDPDSLVIPDSVVENEQEIRNIIATLSDPEVRQAMSEELQGLGQQLGVI